LVQVDERKAMKYALAAGVAALTVTTGLLSLAAPEAAAATRLGGVDMQRACDTQYTGFGLRAVVTDQHNAFSWRCTAPWGYSAGIDINRECVTQYGAGASSGLGSTSDPYSWYCQR
jgi:hypothetical protein